MNPSIIPGRGAADIVKGMLINLGASKDKVNAAALLKEDLALDSLDFLEVCVGLSALSGRQVEDSDLLGFRAVQDLIDFMEKELA